ncbi:hypothetical protein [Sulfurimonas paralvinellae]|uniref:Lipoprotein n=1 Tax=Sulfurimonas paralvinellae TaxID=317658 RepID=A0A7M1B812_9BACT|nr:hypothetical protein [Sulfurimonas paralvinellae]QOP44918.1 hypothetical protein FM071_00845 [Sulfurimonas paralvinellae]
MKPFILFTLSLILLAGCSTTALVNTQNRLPETNTTAQISLFELNNYTDTPRAGMRATNIVEGVLLAQGYHLKTHINQKIDSLEDAQDSAQEDKSDYFLIGGISEWRYKTGIDGEPAVSLQLSLYSTKDAKLIWSATGSDSDWGNGSIGSTAQNLIEQMTARH